MLFRRSRYSRRISSPWKSSNAITMHALSQLRPRPSSITATRKNEDEFVVGSSSMVASPKESSPLSSPGPSRRHFYDPETDYIPISPELEALKQRLELIRHVETMLISKLAPPNEDEATRLHLAPLANSNDPTAGILRHPTRTVGLDQEVFVRSGYSWKGHMAKVLRGSSHKTNGLYSSTAPTVGGRPNSANASLGGAVPDEVTEMLHYCRDDLVALWKDPAVREILRRSRIRLEELPGLSVLSYVSNYMANGPLSFLDQLDRITALDYTPCDGMSAPSHPMWNLWRCTR